ncbi:MFS transporter [Falsiroseomonas selenitidurans]|uniref:MFS transporter n=1 Tax=Falsiroseomonas selenitidurans TaxID=2716335 RepID=A0ABX1E4J0_9PROT|nr:MFS transporter [Falsiroseomonas selenitidurans]NKC32006.1 MFS transporter [Falsiroseomonas selenitidurans]
MTPLLRLASLAPFRQAAFRRQFPADLATSWAFEIETLVLGWFVLVETGSVVWLTAFAALQFLGTLVAPMFGVVGDRIGHRRLLAAMRGFYACQAAAIAAMALGGTLGPWQVVAVAALMGLVRPSDLGLRSALIAASMPPAQMTQAMGISRSTADSARIAGALAGAGLVATLGLGAAYLVVTGLYLFSLACTLSMAVPARPRLARASPWRELRDGIAHVRGNPPLLATMLLAFLVNLAAFPTTGGLLPFVAREIYGLDRSGLGTLVACFAGGALAGTLVVIARGAALAPARSMVLSCLAWFPMLMVFAWIRDPAPGMVLMALIGFTQSFAMVPMSVILLRCAAEPFRGRVMGLRMLAVYGLPIGLLLSGPAIAGLGFAAATTLYAALGLGCTVAIGLAFRRHLWPRTAIANTPRPG